MPHAKRSELETWGERVLIAALARFILATTLLLLAAAAPAEAAAGVASAPRRVVSLNPCLDAILLDVAEPGQIVALSRYSQSPTQSAVFEKARRFPFTGGSAEEILLLHPDLVLSSGLGETQLSRVLPRLNVRMESFAIPSSVEESLAQVRRVAGLVGHPERGEAVVARIEAALSEAAPRPGEPRLGALIYEYHGVASGPNTLMDELMRRAGFDNLASRYGLKRTGEVPLEALILHPPEVLLAGRLAPDEPTWADRALSHPALNALSKRIRRETFPEPLMFCGGPVIGPAIEALALARRNAEQGISK